MRGLTPTTHSVCVFCRDEATEGIVGIGFEGDLAGTISKGGFEDAACEVLVGACPWAGGGAGLGGEFSPTLLAVGGAGEIRRCGRSAGGGFALAIGKVGDDGGAAVWVEGGGGAGGEVAGGGGGFWGGVAVEVRGDLLEDVSGEVEDGGALVKGEAGGGGGGGGGDGDGYGGENGAADD